MTGKYTIRVKNNRVRFELTVERNITILRGDSATGKTTLLNLLRAYEEYGKNSGVSVDSPKPCVVLSGPYWEAILERVRDSIVFIDENSAFEWIKHRNHFILYLPESLEWLILRSSILRDPEIQRILDNPQDYIDSRRHFSWEHFLRSYSFEKQPIHI